jgi:cytochrome c oxidase subunit I+III
MSAEFVAEAPPFTDAERAALVKAWSEDAGFYGWLRAVNHKTIARRFIFTAFVFFILGGLEALVMRLQLAKPENHVLTPDLYNQFFTVHGSTMMFLFAVPVMQAVGLYVVPLMLGTRNMAFPRLSALSYWMFLAGGLLLYVGFALNIGPDAGWFAYTPLSGPEFSPGKRIDVWAQMITFTEISALAAAVNMVATILKHRAPGMSLDRLPLFVWSMLVTSFMVIFAMPAVMVASMALASDRLIGTHFFNAAEGGDALLWQHLFWFFGHPEVYIIFLPALGMVSTVIAAFARRPVVGYLPMVLSLVTTAFMGFGLWVHHMFATGVPQLGQGFFTAASMMIAIPSGVQIFCWIATLFSGRLVFKPPLLFVLGFVAIFVLGGLTGVMLASIPLDLQVHDTFFVVAHFHYVLIGGAVFPLLGGVYYWFPKWTGRLQSDRAGVVSFVLAFIGFNLTFFPMHQLGLMGMPRRVYTYLADRGFQQLNVVASCGALVLALGLIVYFGNALWALKRGALAGANPWQGPELEWAMESPPPPYDFARLPVVRGQHPLWGDREQDPEVIGLDPSEPTVLVVRVVAGEADHRVVLPGPSIAPLLVTFAACIAFIGGIFTPWAFVAGAGAAAIGLLWWFWPKPPHKEVISQHPLREPLLGDRT